MSDEKMRDDFENAMRLQGYKQFERRGEHYQYDDIQTLWQGFKLGRESLVVELPYGDPGDVEPRCFAIDDCRDAIHAAGVRTK